MECNDLEEGVLYLVSVRELADWQSFIKIFFFFFFFFFVKCSHTCISHH